MKIWIDAQLSPKLADWLDQNYAVTAKSVAELGLASASDQEIFDAARHARSTVMTKDHDFVEMHERLGPPPQVIWITCGNTSNASMQASMQEVFAGTFPDALRLLLRGEPLVEITGQET